MNRSDQFGLWYRVKFLVLREGIKKIVFYTLSNNYLPSTTLATNDKSIRFTKLLLNIGYGLHLLKKLVIYFLNANDLDIQHFYKLFLYTSEPNKIKLMVEVADSSPII